MRSFTGMLLVIGVAFTLNAQEPMKRVDAFDTSIEIPISATPMRVQNPALVSFVDPLTDIKWMVERRGPMPADRLPAPLPELGKMFAKGLRLPNEPTLETNSVAEVMAILGGGARPDAHFEYVLCFRGGYIYGFVVGGPPALADKIKDYRGRLHKSIKFTGKNVLSATVEAPKDGLKSLGIEMPGIPEEKWRPMVVGGQMVGMQFFDATNKRVTMVMRQKAPGVKIANLDEMFLRTKLGFRTAKEIASRELKVGDLPAIQHSFLKPARSGLANDRTVVLLIPKGGNVYLIMVTGPDDGTAAIKTHADDLATKAKFVEK